MSLVVFLNLLPCGQTGSNGSTHSVVGRNENSITVVVEELHVVVTVVVDKYVELLHSRLLLAA